MCMCACGRTRTRAIWQATLHGHATKRLGRAHGHGRSGPRGRAALLPCVHSAAGAVVDICVALRPLEFLCLLPCEGRSCCRQLVVW